MHRTAFATQEYPLRRTRPLPPSSPRPFRRLSTGVALVAVLATTGLAPVLAPASATGAGMGTGTGTATDEPGITARYFARTDRSSQAYLPVGPPPAPGQRQPGDRFLLTDALHPLVEEGGAAGPGDRPVGELRSVCTAVAAGAGPADVTVICTAVITFDGRGTLSLQGTIRFRDFVEPGFVTLAVTGGTGRLGGAGGELRIVELNPQDPEGSLDSIYELRLRRGSHHALP